MVPAIEHLEENRLRHRDAGDAFRDPGILFASMRVNGGRKISFVGGCLPRRAGMVSFSRDFRQASRQHPS